jgi:hypothetical protein
VATQAQGQGQASTLNQVFPAAETLGGNFLSQAGMSQQGMFAMVPPGLWNVPLGQWQQLFAQPRMGQMMQMPQGFGGSVQTGTASNSSSGVPVTSQQAQQQPAKNAKKKPQVSGGDAGKKVLEKSDGNPLPPLDPKFKDVVCFNCGEPGHYVGLCSRLKMCFMCGKTGHYMDACPLWYSSMPTAQFWGSANTGLGFSMLKLKDQLLFSG